MTIDRRLERMNFEVATFEVHEKNRRMRSILKLQNVKIAGNLERHDLFEARTCLVSSLCFFCGLAVSMGEAAKSFFF